MTSAEIDALGPGSIVYVNNPFSTTRFEVRRVGPEYVDVTAVVKILKCEPVRYLWFFKRQELLDRKFTLINPNSPSTHAIA